MFATAQHTRVPALALALASVAGCAKTTTFTGRVAVTSTAPAETAPATAQPEPAPSAPPAAPEIQAFLVCDTREVAFDTNEKPAVSWGSAIGPTMDMPVTLKPAYEDAQWLTPTYSAPIHTADKNCTLKFIFKDTTTPAETHGYCADTKGGKMAFTAPAEGVRFNPIKRALYFVDAQTGAETSRMLNPRETCHFLKPSTP